MKVFLSYCRDSEPVARRVVADLASLGHDVWFDQALSGGQAWWAHILDEIRARDLFVFLLHPRALDSTACTRERAYALALGKTVLPLQVADGISVNLLPPDLAQRQIIPYRSGDRDEVLALARAVAAVPPAPALPEPLPEPPEVPSSYLGTLAQRIDAPTLDYQGQSALLIDLRQALREADTRADAEVLLGRLRRRRDLYAAIAEEIDALRERTQPPPRRRPKPVADETPAPAVGPPSAADAAPVQTTPPPAAAPPARARHHIGWFAAAGVVVGLATGSLYLVGGVPRPLDTAVITGFTTVGGLVSGAIVGRDRRSAWVALGVGVAGCLLWLVLGSDSGRDGISQALVFGLGGGAIVGALAGRLWRWRRPG